MLKKNNILTLEITDLTNLGFGVGRHAGQVIFVADTARGDVAEVKVIKVNKSYAVARLERLITPSSTRVEGRCPVSACKSCTYRLIGYSEELKLKTESVRAAFMREGLSQVKVLDAIPSPLEYEYRNKAQYPIAKDKNGEYVIGFFAPKSHRVTEARRCPLAPSVFGDILDSLATFFKERNLSVYDEECGEGLLRHVYLRRGEVSGEILLTLVINGISLPDEDELVRRVRNAFPEIVGILINTNEKNTNVVLGDTYRTLFGRDHIFDTLGGVRLKIAAPAFYQVNRSAAEILYAKARELAAPEKSDLLLDLYCGAGSIGLSIADNCRELIGIEIVESAVECATENAKENGIKNASFFVGDAADCEKLLSVAEQELGKKISPDIIILDPPRAGCDEKLIDYVTRLAPKRIVYVSCNPATLARDASLFSSLGYSIGEVSAVDLFPMTGHVESVVCLTRSDKAT